LQVQEVADRAVNEIEHCAKYIPQTWTKHLFLYFIQCLSDDTVRPEWWSAKPKQAQWASPPQSLQGRGSISSLLTPI